MCEKILSNISLPNEIWKDISNFENMYKISSLGRVFSIRRKRLLTIKKNRNHGYCEVELNYKKPYYFRVHRLVAQAFLPNPNNYPIVMHIDNDKTNNSVDNLKWGTLSQNTKEAYLDGLIKHTNKFTHIKYVITNKKDIKIICENKQEIQNITNLDLKTINKCIKQKCSIQEGLYKKCLILTL